MNYPYQDHIEIDRENDVISFPRRDFKKCPHSAVEIDTKALELICKKCGTKVNPVMWIKDTMQFFTNKQRALNERQEKLTLAEEELERRAKTRCPHCRKMIAINLKHATFKVL